MLNITKIILPLALALAPQVAAAHYTGAAHAPHMEMALVAAGAVLAAAALVMGVRFARKRRD